MDYNKLNLDNVTLLSVDGRDDRDVLDTLINAAKYALKNITFKSVKIISGCRDFPSIQGIEFYYKKIESIEAYNQFVLKELVNYVFSEYSILYQSDGFITNPDNWLDEFLNYDYIGAPWVDSEWNMGNRVGNGGFSLRSRKLLKETSISDSFDDSVSEDLQICVHNKKYLESKGIKFCPPQIASLFSVEHSTEFNSDIKKSFGFHGSSKSYEIYDRTLSTINNLLRNE